MPKKKKKLGYVLQTDFIYILKVYRALDLEEKEMPGKIITARGYLIIGMKIHMLFRKAKVLLKSA